MDSSSLLTEIISRFHYSMEKMGLSILFSGENPPFFAPFIHRTNPGIISLHWNEKIFSLFFENNVKSA